MTLREVSKVVNFEPGMCIELGDNYNTKKMILFKTDSKALCHVIAHNFNWDYMNEDAVLDAEYDRIRIYTSPSSISMFDDHDKIYDSQLNKDNSIINVTISDIAKLYGVSEDRIRIHPSVDPI